MVFHTETRKRKQILTRKPEIVSCPQRSQKTEGKYMFRPDPELQLSHSIRTETFGNIFPTQFQFSPVLCCRLIQLFISWLQAGYTRRGHEGCSCSKQLCKSTSSAWPLCMSHTVFPARHSRPSLKRDIAHFFVDCSGHSALWNTSFPQVFINLHRRERVISFCRQEANKRVDLGIQNQ